MVAVRGVVLLLLRPPARRAADEIGPGSDGYRRDATLREREVIRAVEIAALRMFVRRDAHPARLDERLERRSQRALRVAEHAKVARTTKKVAAVDVEIGDDALDRDGGILGEELRAQKPGLLSRHEHEQQ